MPISDKGLDEGPDFLISDIEGDGLMRGQGWPIELSRKDKGVKNSGICSGFYGMAFVGAAIYFIQQSTTFWSGVFGFIKAIFWPAVLMYKLLEYLKL